jgi:hypothetical protein
MRHPRRLLALVVLLALATPVLAGRPSRRSNRRAPRRISQIRAGVARALADHPKEPGAVPAQLRVLQKIAARGGADLAHRFASRLGVRFVGDRVIVTVRASVAAEPQVVARLAELGAAARRTIRGAGLRTLVPLGEIERVAETPGVERLELPRFLRASVTSEGVATTGAEVWMAFDPPAGLPLGRPARVAIVDVGFLGYAALLGTELPPTVDLQTFCETPPSDPTHCDGFTDPEPFDHGTAVAEIVHDMAPEADLMLLAIDPLVANIQAALTYAADHGADIVSSSIGTPFDNRDGSSPLCDSARALRQRGIVWATAAGNSGEPCEHETYPFLDAGVAAGDPYGNFLGYPAGSDPILDEFILPAGHQHVLELTWNAWDSDPPDDYDLFYYCDFGAGYELMESSIDEQCGRSGSAPFETITFVNNGAIDLPCAYAVAPFDPASCPRPAGRRFETWSFVFDDTSGVFTCVPLEESTPASTIEHPGDCADTLAVGAVCASSGGRESYSSEGPTFADLRKPDLCAPDAVSTATYSTSFGCPDQEFPGFAGTSAATPHVSGALALLFQELGGSFTPEKCRQILETRAQDTDGDGDPDNLCGHGALCLTADGCP